MRAIEGGIPAEKLSVTWLAMDALRIFVNEAAPGQAPGEVQLWANGAMVCAQRYPGRPCFVGEVVCVDVTGLDVNAWEESSVRVDDRVTRFRDALTAVARGYLMQRRRLRNSLRSRVLAHERVT